MLDTLRRTSRIARATRRLSVARRATEAPARLEGPSVLGRQLMTEDT
jgi:hypothetical protein